MSGPLNPPRFPVKSPQGFSVRVIIAGMNFDQSNLLALPSMARRLRVPSRWLRAEALAGRVPCLNAGGRLLFHAPAVEAALIERANLPAGSISVGAGAAEITIIQ
jgi:hypothetical protein